MPLFICFVIAASAQGQEQEEKEKVNYIPKINGTIRAKYEYQTEEGESRFEVRNARVSITGNVLPIIEYKAEIDLSDEGSIKMLDAYTRIKPLKGLDFTIGQMRVPFTIDAHRSPHQQYFANRSFIAKQVGNVRDVGATLSYNFNMGIPVIIEAGLFNGSGLTDQKDYWTDNINFSAKARFFIPQGFTLALSIQKIRPEDINVMMYDGALSYHADGLHIEGEYLFKHYAHDAFKDVHSVNSFVAYDIPLRKCFFTKVTPLVRFDYMTDHSDGTRYNSDGESDSEGSLIINDYRRSRITGGVTFSFAKPFISDIRINYEKYFYSNDDNAKTSERDKIVIEFMTRF